MSTTVNTSSESTVAPNQAEAALETTEETKNSASTSNEAGETHEDSEASENLEDGAKDESNEESEAEEEKSKEPKGFKKRVQKLTKKLSAREQELEYWKSVALSKQTESDPAHRNEKEVTKAEGKPKSEDFDTYEEYTEALTDWKLEQRDKQKEAKEKESQAKSEFQKMNETYESRLGDFVKTQTDFEDVVADFLDEHESFQLNGSLEYEIKASDLGPQIAYELFKNPSEMVRLNGLGPVALAKEIGKLEAKLEKSSESSKTETPKIKTGAPAPITPVSTKSGSVTKTIYDKGLSFSEYEKLRNAQLKSKK